MHDDDDSSHDVSLQTVNYSSALLFLLLANISGFVFLFLCLDYMVKKKEKRLISFFFKNWSAEENHRVKPPFKIATMGFE